ncbi:hypothetical protein GCM10029963_12610 [Micromonospora andamanensis]
MAESPQVKRVITGSDRGVAPPAGRRSSTSENTASPGRRTPRDPAPSTADLRAAFDHRGTVPSSRDVNTRFPSGYQPGIDIHDSGTDALLNQFSARCFRARQLPLRREPDQTDASHEEGR